MSRKTINVLRLLEWANKNLHREDEFATVDFKAGICSMIEMVLHESDNYAGFGFQDNSDIDCGTLGYYSRTYYYSNFHSHALKATGDSAAPARALGWLG